MGTSLDAAIWLLPEAVFRKGWLFGVAVILLGVNVARYIKHIAVSGFSVVLGAAALVAAVSQMWRTDPPLVAIFLLVSRGEINGRQPKLTHKKALIIQTTISTNAPMTRASARRCAQ